MVPAGVAAYHLGPAATWLSTVRRWVPALAGQGRPDHVALTFDDGPGPGSTPAVLSVLEALDVRATFFVLGAELARRPELGRAVCAAGHELAVHGWDHRWLLGRPFPRVREDLARCRDLVADLTGRPPVWFRPPYGVLTGDALLAARSLGLRPVLWTAWGRDWAATATARSVVEAVTPGLSGGATLLLHDADHASAPGAWRSTVAALPHIAALAAARGLAPGPLSEHGVGAPRGPSREEDAHPPRFTPVPSASPAESR
ncbi:polysaccharide deacetylase family protein [Pseudonocardia acidicola]|uniref:Polysaccharide deacetylase family protein n=1 Tax=Pseudonocardia acidicola TaxID=2724939 RepID=A0ABX1SDX6_9PSEU|nr:polysaccharide deacetylase family protein [Pseudonocardia acidicola]NMH98398.1 polysaccharide deacetylase family protein [Pseudonocardia acidicola]